MWSLSHWAAGCWCAASLRICEQLIIPHSEEEDIRLPEQWMFVLWRPMSEPRALGRPDAWGLTVGHPGQELARLTGDGGNIYLLQDDECCWSSWLSIALICERHDPWLTSAVEGCITAQRAAERDRFMRCYGSEDVQFNRFLRRVLTHEKT